MSCSPIAIFHVLLLFILKLLFFVVITLSGYCGVCSILFFYKTNPAEGSMEQQKHIWPASQSRCKSQVSDCWGSLVSCSLYLNLSLQIQTQPEPFHSPYLLVSGRDTASRIPVLKFSSPVGGNFRKRGLGKQSQARNSAALETESG